MSSVVVKTLRFASVTICLIVVLAWAVFAIDQTKGASAKQTAAVSETAATTEPAATGTGHGEVKHENALHEALDEASSALTSPFAGIVSSSSEWVTRSVLLLLALLVYGFGLGYLARALAVRV